jgi:hypothetical protein
VPETAEVIPVVVRTARTRHRCDGYRCRVPIAPGDRYEDHRLPPGTYDHGTYDRWVRQKIHAPHWAQDGPTGCEIAAAYREHATRTEGDTTR